jgi:hypothetical protein
MDMNVNKSSRLFGTCKQNKVKKDQWRRSSHAIACIHISFFPRMMLIWIPPVYMFMRCCLLHLVRYSSPIDDTDTWSMRFDDSRWVQLGVTSISYGGRGRQPIATKPYLSPPGYTRQLAVRLCLCVCVCLWLGWAGLTQKQSKPWQLAKSERGMVRLQSACNGSSLKQIKRRSPAGLLCTHCKQIDRLREMQVVYQEQEWASISAWLRCARQASCSCTSG